MDVNVKLIEIKDANGELVATFRVFATINVQFTVLDGEFNYITKEDPDVARYRKYTWESDESYDVVNAYLFDYEFLYDALREALYYQLPVDDLPDGEYNVSADLIEDFIGVGIKPMGNGKYDGGDVEWIPIKAKLVAAG